MSSKNLTNSHFLIEKEVEIAEIGITLCLLRHKKTGARIVHLQNPEDPENVFAISLLTIPDSSNGVAHILEHTVLCGSKKYPVKDPFFSMTRRSLATFMNALTWPDHTCYPAASEVTQDFYNLLGVYLDAVFYPLLKKESFLQEGHRLAFTESEDLEYQGIVYNEMKGALSSPDSRIWEAIMEQLTPGLTYAHNSGGDPKEIPNLTYEQLRAFHAKFYHPSQALFYFYSNLPRGDLLSFLEEKCLSGFEKAEPLPELPLQPRFKAPVASTYYYPASKADEEAKEAIFTFALLTGSVTNSEDQLALMLLDAILFNNDASPVKRALLDSKLCTQADGYLSQGSTEVPYIIICKGCKQGSQGALWNVIRNSLEQLVKDGIEQGLVDSALHQLEFEKLEITGGSEPYGLSLAFRTLPLMHYGAAPEDGLLFVQQFKALRKSLEDSDFLPALIRRYFLENNHRADITFLPDSTLFEKESAAEKASLSKIEKELSPDRKTEIIQMAKKLEKEEEDKSFLLPMLHLSEVPESVKPYPITSSKSGNIALFHHKTVTNGIVYATLHTDMPELTHDELELFPLFLAIFTQVGVGKLSYKENLLRQEAKLGGISAKMDFFAQTADPQQWKPSFIVQGKSLSMNSKDLMEQMQEALLQTRFDESERISELILQIQESLTQRITKNAPGYARALALAGFSPMHATRNLWHGLPYFKKIGAITHDLNGNLPHVLATLTSIKSKLIARNPQMVISSSGADFETLNENHFYDLSEIKVAPGKLWTPTFRSEEIAAQRVQIPASVAFNCLGLPSISYSHADAPLLLLSSELMKLVTLHPKIREEGGAYGSDASYDPGSATFTFSSFRDPNIDKTFNVFKEAAESVAEGRFTDEQVSEAKLAILQDMDSPVAPGNRGNVGYSLLRSGKTETMRLAFRHKLLTASKQEIARAVKEHLLSQFASAIPISFAGKELKSSLLPTTDSF